MSNLNLKKMARSVRKDISEHSPEILMFFGISGFISTVCLAVKETPKALELLEEEKQIRKENDDPEMTSIDVIRTTWKCYIPAIATGTFSIACLVGSHSKHSKRNASLAAAYKLTEKAFSEYQAKVIETIGEKKEKDIREAITVDHVKKEPVENREVIITGNGKSLCYEDISGRYFECDMDTIKSARNNLNATLINDMYMSLNEWYYEIGLPPTKLGEDLGWNIRDGQLELSFGSTISSDGRPCIVIGYTVPPKYGYQYNNY